MAVENLRGEILHTQTPHYVDWSAAILGTVVASGVATVLFTFGSGIGLSMVSPYRGEGVSKTAYFVALGLWSLWVIISSLMAGGYLAGRLRRRIGDASEHESDVRDASHGLAVWGLSIVVASLLMMAGVSGLVGTATKSETAAGAASGATAALSNRSDRMDFTIDAMFRGSDQTARAAEAERREIARLLTYGVVRGELSAENRTYLTRLVAARTGATPEEAQQRIETALADARREADAARKSGIIATFLTAAALLVGAAAAAWAAALGGKHRDQETAFVTFWRWP
jgi:hypothetical protein